MPMKFPTITPPLADDLRRLPGTPDLHGNLLNAATVAMLKRTPASQLSDDEKMGLFIAHGVPIKAEAVDGSLRVVTAVPVGIADRGDGGYIIGVGKAS